MNKLISSRFFPDVETKKLVQLQLLSGRRLFAFSITAIQLILLFYILDKFAIEHSSGIKEIELIVLIGFALNSFSPLWLRPFVLFMTGIAAIYFAFGFFTGNILITAGFALIGCCHLPIRFWLRILLILGITAGLVILRLELFYAPRAALITPFLASMFMFRLFIYLYEIKHQMTGKLTVQNLSYFFLFPNVCFLFFPIIDHKTYIKTYYNICDHEIWQKGIRLILRGIVHLLCYRIVYYYLTLSPTDVIDLPSFLQYIICTYILVMRLSGIFHLILGMLCLFGLNLPEAFNNFFIATSFTDLWRRINVYWREFISKVFYYPLIFRLKKKSSEHAMSISIIAIFILSWILHNYQLFWVRGSISITITDFAFWLLMGTLIAYESIREERKRLNPQREHKVPVKYFIHMFKIVGMFILMSLLWSIWEAHSLRYWAFLFSKSFTFNFQQLLIILIAFVLLFVVGILVQYVLANNKVNQILNKSPQHTLALTLPSILLIALITLPKVQAQLPPYLDAFIQNISSERLNQNDKAQTEQGYYGKLLEGESNKPSGLWEIRLKRQKNYKAIGEAYIRTDDLLTKIIAPNIHIKGENYSFESNSFGLRDKEYTLKKNPLNCRVALLGGSYEMGAGVSNNEVFEAITEERLNMSNTDSCCKKYEILNFANSGFYLIQQVELCNTKVFDFEPDAVMYCAHNWERKRMALTFTALIQQGKDLKYEYLESIKTRSGVKQSMSESEIESRLQPYIYELIKWCYIQIAESCRKHGKNPVWVFVPTTQENFDTAEYEEIKSYAEKLHFTILDLRGAYGSGNINKLQQSEWDSHPNAKGQKKLADKFYEEFTKNSVKIFKKK